MVYDYSKLKGRIVEVCGTRKAFALRLNVSYLTLLNKLNSKTEWTQSEIDRACSILEIPLSDLKDYFFTATVKEL